MRIWEHIRISPSTKKKEKPKGSAASNYYFFLTIYNHSPSFESFNVLTKENKKSALELKENLLKIRDKHSLNKNIRSVISIRQSITVTPIQEGLFGAAHRWGRMKKAPLPKICHTYPKIMKLCTVIPYLNKIYIYFS